MSQKTFYVIDGSSYLYRAYHALPKLFASSGLPTGAVHGFGQMLLKLIKENAPDYLAMVFDAPGPTQRHHAYSAYKAQRPSMPDDLIAQIVPIHQLVNAFQVPIVMREGEEADDIIGTLAVKAAAQGVSVVIVSGDKDMLQLVSPDITLYDTLKQIQTNEQDIQTRFGVTPSQMVEVMGLMGDSVDNLPGVTGIGKKGALELVQTFGTIEHLLENLNQVKRPSVRRALETQAHMARMTRDLARIDTHLPIAVDLAQFSTSPIDPARFSTLCQTLDLFHLWKQVAPYATASASVETDIRTSLTNTHAVAAEIVPGAHIETSAIALSFGGGESTYFPQATTLSDFALEALSDPTTVLYGHPVKPLLALFQSAGIFFTGRLFDTLVASHLLHPNRRDTTLETVVFDLTGTTLPSLPEEAASADRGKILCLRAERVLQLGNDLEERLTARSLMSLFETMEMPLIPVLMEIERNGILIDPTQFAVLSSELADFIDKTTQDIHQLAGCLFNVHSPKQLAEVLFNKNRLGLPAPKKIKTGYSTSEEVLRQLSHPLPDKVLQLRQAAKLKSTYVDVLPKMAHPDTGRVHTQLQQAATATGRLSSKEPNLQNIPVRSEMGQRIRKAFISAPGTKLLCADYNQIELRILSHLSQDAQLVRSFQAGEDVHRKTAAQLFGCLPDAVTADMRRTAKTVNFGIIYGITPFGLSNSLGVSQIEAKKYIERYFSYYSGVRDYIETVKRQAIENGTVTTLFGRLRDVPEILSANSLTRSLGERLAINTPVQGTAADIIKLAMIAVASWMRQREVKSKMVLQVHDELIFEVPETEVVLMRQEIVRLMEGIPPVPLKVDVGIGNNWAEAHRSV